MSIEEKILQHIVKTNQCAKWPKDLKPFMITLCGGCPLKDKCYKPSADGGSSPVHRPAGELAKEALEEMSREKIKEVLGIEDTEEIKNAQTEILKVLMTKPQSCSHQVFETEELKKFNVRSICHICPIREECENLVSSKGNKDHVIKERHKLAVELYNRRELLKLLDPND